MPWHRISINLHSEKMVEKNFSILLENFIFKWYHQFLDLWHIAKRGHVAENHSEAGEEKNHFPSIINRKIEFLENAGTHPMYLEMPAIFLWCYAEMASTLWIYGYWSSDGYATTINFQ